MLDDRTLNSKQLGINRESPGSRKKKNHRKSSKISLETPPKSFGDSQSTQTQRNIQEAKPKSSPWKPEVTAVANLKEN